MDTTIQFSLSDLRRVAFEALAVYMAFWALGTAAVACVIWKSHRRRE
ncbi:MAG: hypothetical protein AAB270_07395 [Chloroflexota bacterium]